MTDAQIQSFLQDCVVLEDDTDQGLDLETIYGLYISWCVLGRKVPIPDDAFRTALDRHGLKHTKHKGLRMYPGLRMVGPAARDYIVNSVPILTESDMPAWSDSDDDPVPSFG
ncbi:hypothetical protein ACIQC5_08680 [Paenarthrobacter sp. NPDC092416]|uniref:hypothetical protein n=1 Tax=Paenarthrobacter sp. NPDC092416 TaxID=3364386 RepID=UPI003824879E